LFSGKESCQLKRLRQHRARTARGATDRSGARAEQEREETQSAPLDYQRVESGARKRNA